MCARIKEHEATSHIPVLILTAKNTADTQIDGYEIVITSYSIHYTKLYDWIYDCCLGQYSREKIVAIQSGIATVACITRCLH